MPRSEQQDWRLRPPTVQQWKTKASDQWSNNEKPTDQPHSTRNPLINTIQLENNEKQRKKEEERENGGDGDRRLWRPAIDGSLRKKDLWDERKRELWVWESWYDEMRKREWGESKRYGEERETNTNILNGRVMVTVHICTVTVVVVHICTFLH